MKVILAEDDTVTRFLLTEMLEELGIEYDACNDGRECLDLLNRNPDDYAMILMDIHMPRVSGPEATQTIRKALPRPQNEIAILAITADETWRDEARIEETGFTGILPKPVTIDALRERLLADS